MKIARKIGFFAVLAIILVVTSCTSYFKSVPEVNLPLVKAEYTILGETTGAAEGKVILGFIYVGEKKFGSVGYGSAFYPVDLVKQTALYNALMKMPEADEVMAPAFDIEQKNGFLSVSWKVTVRATGIKYKEGPVSK